MNKYNDLAILNKNNELSESNVIKALINEISLLRKKYEEADSEKVSLQKSEEILKVETEKLQKEIKN